MAPADNTTAARRGDSISDAGAEEKISPEGDAHAPLNNTNAVAYDYEGKPTEEQMRTLRRVPGKLPTVAYLICIVEFCERASYYGVQPLINNYVNRKLPDNGNGYGAPPIDPDNQQTPGALGMGTSVANAVSQSFSMLAYALPLLFGYISDTRTGRFNMILYGIGVFGVAHVLMCAAGAPNLLASGMAKVPYFISLYTLAVGAAMFKPNVSPLLLDQMTHKVPVVVETKSGELVIQDPEHSAERVMLWFYLLINIGGFMNVATTYCEKYVGWWLAFLIPLILYLPLPLLMWWLKPKLILHPPGGSDLGNVMKVIGICFRRGGLKRIGRKGFWDVAKPSHIAASGLERKFTTSWNDAFVDDVRRTFQATGIFCFFPIQYINDNGLGSSVSFLSTMLTTNGVPNDVINNFNSLSIILMAPVLNYGLYPLLRRMNIHYGPVARMTTGLAMSTLGGVGYTILQKYAYEQSPCGEYGSNECLIGTGVAPISIWWTGIPLAIGGISELFINVPAYGIAYSRAPVNMRGLVSALNLFNTAIAYIIGLACSSVVRDPFLVWCFGGPTIVGGVLTVVFYFTFRHIDAEEFTLTNAEEHQQADPAFGTHTVVAENELNKSVNKPAPIGENEEMMISQKQ